jgi:hypothetical protein
LEFAVFSEIRDWNLEIVRNSVQRTESKYILNKIEERFSHEEKGIICMRAQFVQVADGGRPDELFMQ